MSYYVGYSDLDVLAIWDCLADFIERQMLQVKVMQAPIMKS